MTGFPLLGRMAFGLRTPKVRVPGRDIAGTVEAVGARRHRLRRGRRGLRQLRATSSGSFAEFGLARANRLAPKPANLTFEQAAAVPISGSPRSRPCARPRSSPASPSPSLGASGGVGSYVVQMAKAARRRGHRRRPARPSSTWSGTSGPTTSSTTPERDYADGRPLRRDHRHRRQPLPGRAASGAHPEGPLRDRRRRDRRPLARRLRPQHPRRPALPVRRPDPRHGRLRSENADDLVALTETDRVRPGHPGRRAHLPPGRRRRWRCATSSTARPAASCLLP